jgi:hypothetical protein
MTPVTTYRAMCYYEPVTTCCQTSGGPAVAAPNGNAVPAPAPGAEETREPLPGPPPGTKGPAGTEEQRYPYMPKSNSESSYRKIENAPPTKFVPPHFASLQRDSHSVAGRLVDGDRKAQGNAKVLFVNVERKSNQQTATTDGDGRFKANLGEGAWLVYTYDNAGKPVFSRRVEVPAGRTVQLTLVNR